MRHRISAADSVTSPCAWYQYFQFAGIKNTDAARVEIDIMEKHEDINIKDMEMTTSH